MQFKYRKVRIKTKINLGVEMTESRVYVSDDNRGIKLIKLFRFFI